MGHGRSYTYKHEAFMFGSAIVDVERGQFAEQKPYYWQTDTAVARNSGAIHRTMCISRHQKLFAIWWISSKNGCLLLNIGPKPDGTIPQEIGKYFKIGDWLKINGEAIYGSKVWRTYGEGPTKLKKGSLPIIIQTFHSEDIRFTVNGSSIYACVLSFPENGVVRIKSLAEQDASRLPLFHGIIKDVTILGFDEKPVWERNAEALTITTKEVKSNKPVVFKIQVD